MTDEKHRADLQVSDLLEFAIELAGVAATAALPLFRNGLTVDNKLAGGFDPVTEADRAAEIAIRTLIETSYPNHGILGEEFGQKPANDRWSWILDPIDGTRSFISGTPTWMTLIGIMCDGRPVAGVASQPFTGEIFAGSANGSFLMHGNTRTSLKCTSETDLGQVLAGTTGPDLFARNGHHDRLEKVKSNVRHMRFDADAYFHCMVAAGQLGLGLDTGLQSYDIAALIPIVEGAGGIVTTWDGSDASGGGDIIVAANKSIHRKAMALLK